MASSPGSGRASQSWSRWTADGGSAASRSGRGPPGWRCQCQASSRIPPLDRPAASTSAQASASPGTPVHGRNSSATRMPRAAARSHRLPKPRAAAAASASTGSRQTATTCCAPTPSATSRVRSASGPASPAPEDQPTAASTTSTDSPRDPAASRKAAGSGSNARTWSVQTDTPPQPAAAAASRADTTSSAPADIGSADRVDRQSASSPGEVTCPERPTASLRIPGLASLLRRQHP